VSLSKNSLHCFTPQQSDGYQIRMGIFGGNVGIGTVTPGVLLDVAGDINTSTQYTADHGAKKRDRQLQGSYP
jgi:hypothetical protein